MGFSLVFNGNSVFFIDFIGDLSSVDGATETSSLNPCFMRTALFCETFSLRFEEF